MPLRTYKPTSPGQRGTVLPDFAEITKKKPEKSLLAPLKKTGGRNNSGIAAAATRDATESSISRGIATPTLQSKR